jgi:hypothetical protein
MDGSTGLIMPAIDFPSGAESGDLHVSAGKTWTFNGSGWVLVTIPTAMFSAGAVAGSSLTEDSVPLNKLVDSDPGNIVMYNSSGVAASTTISGDVTMSSSGALTIDNGVISDTHIAVGAEINPEKIAGTAVVLTDQAVITSYMIEDGTIENGDISPTANIAQGKIADILTNAQAASYTLVIADKNKIVEMGVGSANDLTVPPNSSVAFPIGSQIQVLQTGTGKTRILAGAGVTVNATPGVYLRAQWSGVTLLKRASDVWVATGDLSAT